MSEVDSGGLEAAHEEIRRRIRADALRLSDVWRPMFEALEQRVFDPTFRLGPTRKWLGNAAITNAGEFVETLGCTPAAYLRQLRVEAAQALGTVAGVRRWQVARRSGFKATECLLAAERRTEGKPMPTTTSAAEEPAPRLSPKTPSEHVAAPLRRVLAGLGEPADVEDCRAQLEAMVLADALPGYERRWLEFWWPKIRALPAAQLGEKLEAVPCETAAIFEFLCERSREEGRDDRQRGVMVAELARAALEWLAPRLPAREVSFWQAKVWGCLGNARCAALDFAGAETALDTAEGFLSEAGVTPELHAEVAFVRSCLRCAQRRFTEAVEQSDAALHWLGDQPGRLQAQILMARAQAFAYQGEAERAIPDLLEAIAVLEGANDPYIAWTAHQNLAGALWLVGRLEEAAAWLQRARAQAARLGRLAAWCHTLWLEGLLADQQGRTDDAVARLREACAGLQGLGVPAEAAVAALDLAKVETARGEHEVALRRVVEAMPHLEGLQLEREGVEALALLRRGVEARRLSAAVLGAARRHVARAVGVAEPPSCLER